MPGLTHQAMVPAPFIELDVAEVGLNTFAKPKSISLASPVGDNSTLSYKADIISDPPTEFSADRDMSTSFRSP